VIDQQFHPVARIQFQTGHRIPQSAIIRLTKAFLLPMPIGESFQAGIMDVMRRSAADPGAALSERHILFDSFVNILHGVWHS